MRFAAPLTFAAAFLATTFALAPSVRAADPSSDDSAPFAGRPIASSAPMASGGGYLGIIGQWVVTVQSANDASTNLHLHKTSGGGWDLNIHPALDYFLTSRVSVGGVVGFGYDSSGVTTVGLGARAGYNLNIADRYGLWPTIGVFSSYTTGNHMSDGRASLGIFAPFLYHAAPHFFLGLGPTFNLGLTDGNGKEYGLDFVIGGWI